MVIPQHALNECGFLQKFLKKGINESILNYTLCFKYLIRYICNC